MAHRGQIEAAARPDPQRVGSDLAPHLLAMPHADDAAEAAERALALRFVSRWAGDDTAAGRDVAEALGLLPATGSAHGRP